MVGPLCDPIVNTSAMWRSAVQEGASTHSPCGPQLQKLLLPETLGNSPREILAVFLMTF